MVLGLGVGTLTGDFFSRTRLHTELETSLRQASGLAYLLATDHPLSYPPPPMTPDTSIRNRLFVMMVLEIAIWGAWQIKIFPYMGMLDFTPNQIAAVGSVS